jgi:hypothetical protein
MLTNRGIPMTTRVATALSDGTAVEAAARLAERTAQRLEGQTPALALVFASTAQPLGELMPELSRRMPGTTLLGASTAGEFTEEKDSKGAVALFAVAGDYRVHAALERGLGADPEGAVSRAVARLPDADAELPHRTALLLLDPLAGRGEEATLAAAALLGGDVRLAGGAAGDDLRMKQTWVACGGEVASDALVLATIHSKMPLGVGVCHGHRPIADAVKVTRASGNVVHELDGKPAWSVWSERTRDAAGKLGIDPDQLGDDAIGAFLLRFEAGLANGSEYKIRAPLGRAADGSLSFACGIPEGAMIRITESVPEDQVTSAREAARRARHQIAGAEVAGAVVFDCICRNLILGQDFHRAVGEIGTELGKVPLAGFETYGEIALDAGDMSGFHNTTTVVLAFPR